MIKFRYNKYEIIFILLFTTILFQSIISEISNVFSFTDEIFAIFGLYIIIQKSLRKYILRRYPKIKRIIKIIIVICLIGCLSTLRYKLQTNVQINLFDCFTILKVYLIMFVSIHMLNHCRKQIIINYIYKITSGYIIVGFIFLLISQIIDVGMSFEKRFGLNDYMFINPNPGDYASILIICLVIFHIISFYHRESIRLLKFLTIILIIFTFRGKSLGFIATYIMIVLFINKYNKISKFNLIILSILGVIGGYFQIRYYFLDNITPRALLLANGIVTANDHFPLGAGFSTYGSNMAKIYYSPLYEKYGFESIWGMNQEETQFLNDNFWPMIMGQFGWLGLLLYVLILIIMFKLVNNEIQSKQLKIAGFSIFFLLLYSSIGGPIFVHYIGCASIIIFSLILEVNRISNLSINNNNE